MIDKKPVIAISMGDPNGVGPELIVKLLQRKDILSLCTPIVFAPGKLWSFYRKHFGVKMHSHQIESADKFHHNKINVCNIEAPELKIKWGSSDNTAGSISFESLRQAAEAVKNGIANALVTAPINKANIQSDQFSFPGHTEYLANVWEGEALMFMVHEDIKVGLVTQHIPIAQVAESITKEAVYKKIQAIRNSLISDYGIDEPKIAVMGLNPHAGDNGLLGKEEQEIITPAIEKCLEKNQKVFGVFSADSFFSYQNLRKYDAVLAMYHDQGLIPFKTLAGWEGVNYTAGLSFVRTSPDHGVGYEIAGENIADETSMVEAVYTVINILNRRNEWKELNDNKLQPQKIKEKTTFKR